jgi:extracellular factor (EF) 3-hydroxypalmitic acid methyl ester biosynthesis protein
MFARFEEVSAEIDEELAPAHRAFGQRQLHPHLLCGPFIHRCFAKPLGYAGDYEMMNMIVRNGLEGNSLYAKLVNAFLLDQVGPQAVRSRVDFLYAKIVDETSRIAREGRTANIYCIACGPAWEAQKFVAQSLLADQAQFQLMDFNEETLRHTATCMEDARRKHHRKTSFKLVKDTAQNLIKGRTKAAAAEPGYDLIYCSGLYDYLNDRVIKELNTHLYGLLQPGGLLVVGNFAPNTPTRNFIEHFLEWFLIFRDSKHLAALAPKQASPADCRVMAEQTGTNIFLEVRKPR